MSVIATAPAAVVAPVKQVGQGTVSPHTVNNGDENWNTASRKYVLKTVAAATCCKK